MGGGWASTAVDAAARSTVGNTYVVPTGNLTCLDIALSFKISPTDLFYLNPVSHACVQGLPRGE